MKTIEVIDDDVHIGNRLFGFYILLSHNTHCHPSNELLSYHLSIFVVLSLSFFLTARLQRAVYFFYYPPVKPEVY